ncbi:MAG: hypothetical protein KBT47_07780 [Armatimonadetes bacterium]|nr:hypothetical protein [Candidatus Hippobium faecium]
MLRSDKVLWEDIIKLLSFGTAEKFAEELAIENIYDEETSEIARDVLDPRQLPHYETDTFDIWNTYIEKVLPGAYLDKIEEEISEDRACDIEDYFFYMERKYMLGAIFNYWWSIFNDFRLKNPESEIVSPELDKVIDSYIEYMNNITEEINSFEIEDPWDLYIDSLYVPEEFEEEEPEEEDGEETVITDISYVKELITRFVFTDISFDFWTKIYEFDTSLTDRLKEWAKVNYGEESEPYLPELKCPAQGNSND